MARFQTACKLSEIPMGAGRTVGVGRHLIAIFRDEHGIHAIDDMCPHMGASLGGGEVENGIVTCPWHGWRFKVACGTWADNPRIKVASYPVRVIEDEIQVEVPDPAPLPPSTPSG